MSKQITKIAVLGIGGVGGYFGGRIANKINQDNLAKEIYFIGRGEHLQTIQKQGLTLVTDQEELHCFPNIATDNLRHIPTPDLYLLCVKGYDLDNAVTSLAKNIARDTIILPLLNGVDIYERIRAGLPKAIISPAAVYISSSIDKPGTIRQKGSEGHLVFGKDPKHASYDYRNLLEFFKEMEISATWYENPYPAIWEKYIFIAPFSLITAISGRSIGEVLADSHLRNITENIIKEIISIARAKNINLSQDIIEQTMQKAERFPYETKTSFQRDYEKGNNRHEGDLFGGTLIRMAEEQGIAIPTITEIYRKLISK